MLTYYSQKMDLPKAAHPHVSKAFSIPKLAVVLLIFGALSAIFGALYLYNPHFFGRHFEEIKVLGYGTLGGGFLLFALGAVWSLKTSCRSTKSSITSSSPAPTVPISISAAESVVPKPVPVTATETHHTPGVDYQFIREANQINKKKVMRVFYGPNQDPYKGQLKRIIEAGHCEMSILNLTHRVIQIPSFKALQILTKRYAEEHSIALDVATTERLSETLQTSTRSMQEHSFVGFVVTSPDDSNRHACSVICHKGPNGLEFLVIETTGQSWEGARCVETRNILQRSFPGAKIFNYVGQNQADSYSCRTGAIVLLTRALTDLKQQTVSLFTLLSPQGPESFITKLPPGWLTKEQIYTAQTQAETQERESDMEEVIFQCSINFSLGAEAQQAQVTAREQLQGLERPPEVTQCLTESRSSSRIQFKVRMLCNTYLVRQGYIHAQMCAAATSS